MSHPTESRKASRRTMVAEGSRDLLASRALIDPPRSAQVVGDNFVNNGPVIAFTVNVWAPAPLSTGEGGFGDDAFDFGTGFLSLHFIYSGGPRRVLVSYAGGITRTTLGTGLRIMLVAFAKANSAEPQAADILAPPVRCFVGTYWQNVEQQASMCQVMDLVDQDNVSVFFNPFGHTANYNVVRAGSLTMRTVRNHVG